MTEREASGHKERQRRQRERERERERERKYVCFVYQNGRKRRKTVGYNSAPSLYYGAGIA